MPDGRHPNDMPTDYDAIVVGAGIGGIYTLYRLKRQGLSVLGLESASGVGGVWFHNRYPGARVDVESAEYCYHFSQELFDEWRWSELYAPQAELLAYFNHVVDRFDLKRHILFETPLRSARWHPEEGRYHVEAGDGRHFTCRFLIMATGNLSAARKPDFAGLDSFEGEWMQASHWPDRPVEIAGKRVAVIGTGSSGVQAIPVIAEQALHLTVFQRTPNFSVPARNVPVDKPPTLDVSAKRAALFKTRAGITSGLPPLLPYADFTEAERQARLEAQWAYGGQGMNRIFTDQGTDQAVNDVVANFVRARIREIVADPDIAEKLCPYDHPIGSRRLCVDTNYYATYNHDNVTLVDVSADPIERITPTGIQTRDGHHPVDLIVFALGFNAFRGALDHVDIRNERDETPTQHWQRGPRTMLGLMTEGFPNFFFLTGPGSPSVLANMVLMNEVHADWVAALIAHMDANGFETVAPEPAAIDDWTGQVAQAASKLLRLGVKNYMVHVNHDDGSRVFMPYIGGFDRYAEIVQDIAAAGYAGFRFGHAEAEIGARRKAV